METPGITKDLSLLLVGVTAGLLTWILDKVGVEMPRPILASLGLLAIVGFSWGAFNLTVLLIPRDWRIPRISLPGAICFMATATAMLWWLSASLGWTRQDLTKFPDKKPERISGKTYTGGVVEIDGRIFEHCIFKDVTMMYHGTGSWSLIEPTFQGSVYLKTDNKAIHDFTTMREYVNGFASGLNAYDIDDTGRLHALNKSDPTTLRWSDQQESIYDKEFANVSINTDGKRFERCKFTNVSFIYEGVGPADFIECKLLGSVNLVTYSKANMGLMGLQNFLQTVSGTSKINISGRDASGAIVPFNVTKH
jgi:hypothetical protein